MSRHGLDNVLPSICIGWILSIDEFWTSKTCSLCLALPILKAPENDIVKKISAQWDRLVPRVLSRFAQIAGKRCIATWTLQHSLGFDRIAHGPGANRKELLIDTEGTAVERNQSRFHIRCSPNFIHFSFDRSMTPARPNRHVRSSTWYTEVLFYCFVFPSYKKLKSFDTNLLIGIETNLTTDCTVTQWGCSSFFGLHTSRQRSTASFQLGRDGKNYQQWFFHDLFDQSGKECNLN